MSVLEDAKREILERHQNQGSENGTHADGHDLKPDMKSVRQKRQKTKEEIEAYRRKMIEREEEKALMSAGICKSSNGSSKLYTGADRKEAPSKAKAKKRKTSQTRSEGSKGKPCDCAESLPEKKSGRKDAQKKDSQAKRRKSPKSPKSTKSLKSPMSPLEPMYLLKIPGLPKGDCIAICYVRGATA